MPLYDILVRKYLRELTRNINSQTRNHLNKYSGLTGGPLHQYRTSSLRGSNKFIQLQQEKYKNFSPVDNNVLGPKIPDDNNEDSSRKMNQN